MADIPGTLLLVRQSVHLDQRTLRANRLPLGWRLGFIAQKYLALVSLVRGRAGTVRVSPMYATVKDSSALGTLQSSILDFHDDIVVPNLLDGDSPLIIDVGANVGQFCLAVKLHFPAARILSFEPDPDAFAQLKMNTSGLSDVQVFNFGLGDRSETRPFRRHHWSVMSTFDDGAEDPGYGTQTLDLQLRRLDDVVGTDLNPDLIKIDVEGFERRTVLGARAVLERTRWLILELSLGRQHVHESNLAVLQDLRDIAPGARIVKFGRPLGTPSQPECQDVVVQLAPMGVTRTMHMQEKGSS